MVFPIPTDRVERVWLMLSQLAHFYHLMEGRKGKPGLCLQQAENIVALNPQLFCQKLTKKIPLVK